MPPVTAVIGSIDESAEGEEDVPSELPKKEDALVREVKVNLAHLHRKIDIMSAQVNRKLDSIMAGHDCTIDCMPHGTSYGKEWYKQSNEIGPGAMSGKYINRPLPPPAASFLRADVEDIDNPNRKMSYQSHEPKKLQSVPEVNGTGSQTMRASGKNSQRSVGSGRQTLVNAPGFSKILETSRNKQLKWHQRVLIFLEEPDSSNAAFIYSKVVSTAIFCSILLNFAQTIKPPTLNPDVFVPIEMFCDAIFLGEVSVRFSATPNKLGFFMSYHNCIDVLSSGPALILRGITQYTPYSSTDSAEDIRYIILCISPVFRMLKMLRRWKKFNLLMYSGISLISEVMPVLLVVLFVMAFTFSSAIYLVEPRDNIDAMPKALWFTIITMSTVGYGDVSPKTTLGSMVTLVLVICSALYMAVPLGIAGNAFSKVWDERDWLLLIKYMHERLTVNNYKASDIPSLFRTFGNDSGEIALDDFVRMISEMELGIREDRILDLFFSFDSDNSGTIDSMEFIKVIFPSQFVQMYGRKSKEGRKSLSLPGENLRSTKIAARDRGSFDGSHSGSHRGGGGVSCSYEMARKRESSFDSTTSSSHNARLLSGGITGGRPSPREREDVNRVLVGITEKKETDYFFA